MKKLIIAVLAVITFSFFANASSPAEEIRLLLSKMEAEGVSKDEEILRVHAELQAAKAVIAKMREEPDLEQAIKVRFDKALKEASNAVNKLTEEVIVKINSLKK
jgi:hypothetical protein